MIKLPTAKASKLEAVCATVMLKNCSTRLSPPKKKHIPMTRRRFDNMLPIRDSCTMSTSFLTNAMMDTISSTALLSTNQLAVAMIIGRESYPNVAFSKPPIVSPVRKAISSVA